MLRFFLTVSFYLNLLSVFPYPFFFLLLSSLLFFPFLITSLSYLKHISHLFLIQNSFISFHLSHFTLFIVFSFFFIIHFYFILLPFLSFYFQFPSLSMLFSLPIPLYIFLTHPFSLFFLIHSTFPLFFHSIPLISLSTLSHVHPIFILYLLLSHSSLYSLPSLSSSLF